MYQDASQIDTRQFRQQRIPFISLLIGAAAGATAGLLFAPSRGRDARSYLQNRTRAGTGAVSRAWEKGRSKLRHRTGRTGQPGGDAMTSYTGEQSANAVIDRAVAERAAAERDHIIEIE